ncbi:MAG: malate dehydrogenase [Thermaerobacter sp.]|nr:malate dehydrogenase [Thermaerobacter sp.]
MREKVTVLGAGNVGATTAHWLMTRNTCDVVLVDVVEGVPQGKALDLYESAPVSSASVRIVGDNDYAATKGSSVVVVTAGIGRKPGMSRDDLLKVNYDVVSDVVKKALAQSPDAIFITVTNPVDVMTYVTWKATGLAPNKVFGMAGVLDSARFRTFIAMELGVSPKDVVAFVMGGHGDAMLPLTRYSSVGGIPVEKLVPKDRLDAIVARTRTGGGEIVNLLKTGSAYFAPGASTAEMVEAVLGDQKRVLPVVAHLDGEYGQKNIYVGVPALIGKNGVEKVFEIDFTDEEASAFQNSVQGVRGPLSVLGL